MSVPLDGNGDNSSKTSPVEHGPAVTMPLLHVPRNAFFVLGDSLENSEDSRSYGPIARLSIIGKKCKLRGGP